MDFISVVLNDKGPINRSNGGEIYRIWFANDDSGKCYIGQTVQGSLERIKQHIADAQSNEGGCPLLDEATRKFGINAMRYEILETGIQTHEDLDAAEKFWIKKFRSQHPFGYNVKSGGQGKGATCTPIVNNNPSGFSFGNLIGKAKNHTSGNLIANALIDTAINTAPISEPVKGVLKRFF